jgi:hypothetical protein
MLWAPLATLAGRLVAALLLGLSLEHFEVLALLRHAPSIKSKTASCN